MHHIADRFIVAVRVCTGSSPVKQRLTEAWLTQLDEIDPNELPAHMRQEFQGLRDAMYERKPQPNESAPKASIRKMSIRQATRYTTLIVRMLGEILRVKHTNRKQKLDTADNAMFENDFEANRESNQRLN